jgi:hypothetical protein
MRYTTLITLCGSFILSTAAFIVANDNEETLRTDVPVQYLEFDPIIIQPDIEYIEFTIDESIAQDNDESDGDTEGIDWDLNREFWCQTHPDECTIDVEDLDEDDERTC